MILDAIMKKTKQYRPHVFLNHGSHKFQY